MPWLGLAATLAWNYRQHRHGRPTICAVTRRTVPKPVLVVAYPAGAVGLFVHVWRGYPSRSRSSMGRGGTS